LNLVTDKPQNLTTTSKAWLLSGNSNTAPPTDFIGTTDAKDWVVKTSGSERLRVLAAGNVGIGTPSPTERLDVSGNVRFSGALMPNNQPGSVGDILVSQGPNTAPVWRPAGDVIQSYGVSSSRTTVSGTTYVDVTGLTQTITVTKPSLLFISSWGAMETFSTSTSGGSLCRVGVFNNGSTITEQTVDIVNNNGFTSVVHPWSISTYQSVAAGTYTIKISAKKYNSAGSGFYAGGSSTSLANEGSLTILVIPQ
jgi:hypothetical protein